MRLIDADDLIEVINAAYLEKTAEVGLENIVRMTILTDFARDVIRYAPTIDAVQIVRCRDCKHYWKNYTDDCSVPVCLASPSDDAYC